MAINIAQVTGTRDFVVGNLKAKVRHVTLDNSYPTGGYSVAPKDVGLRSIAAVLVTGAARKNDGTSALNASFDHSAGKLILYWSAAAGAAPAQVTNATDLSTYSVRLVILGTGTG